MLWENREKRLLKCRQYYQNNKDYLKEKGRQYYINNKAKCNELARQWRIKKRADPDYREKKRINGRVWYHKNKNKRRESLLKNRHGITLQKYNFIIDRQNGKCAICKTEDWGLRGPVIDHNHKNKKIRGILCGCCNLGLGHFKDNYKLLEVAIDYLKQYEK